MNDQDTNGSQATEYALAAAVARYVDLKEVRLIEVSAKLIGGRDAMIQKAPWELRFKRAMAVRFDDQTKELTVIANLAVDVLPEKPGEESMVCSCVFHLDYVFNVNGGPEGDDLQRHLKAFANVNGTYNVWPYFRELVQSMASRVGMPPIVVPVYRVQRPQAVQASVLSKDSRPAVAATAAIVKAKAKAKAKGAKATLGRR